MTDRAGTLIVIAKEPLPGRAKTRLQAEFSADEAAALAAASLADTCAAVRAARAPRRVLAWQGDRAAAPEGFDVVPQPSGTLNDRLTAAFAAVLPVAGEHDPSAESALLIGPAAGSALLIGPEAKSALLIGMDTPQVTADLLDVDWEEADAVLGLSDDGGFWAIGLRAGHPPRVFDGVPMSTDRTGSAQLGRLFDLKLTVKLLPPLRDVDLPVDADHVAVAHPHLEFARCHRRLVGRRPEQAAYALFDRAYDGTTRVHSGPAEAGRTHEDGQALPMEVRRWSAEADAVDELVVARCEAPVIDLGCGPGRMVRALNRSGRVALGVDISAVAVAVSMAARSPALRRRIEEPLPAEGRWGTALLMDSNIGIGGDVTALLRRCRALVGAGGLIICEVDPLADRHEVHQVVLRDDQSRSQAIPWSRIGTRALQQIAAGLGIWLVEEWQSEERAFVTLRA